MSETNTAPQKEKAAKVRRKPERESVLTPTFAASRQSISGSLWDDRGQQGSGILQRQCACGTHTIAGGECDTCRKKRETSFLQRTAVTPAPDDIAQTTLTEAQPVLKLGSTRDFSQIPARTHAPTGIQPKLEVNAPGDIYEQEADRVADAVMRMSAPTLTSSSTEIDSFLSPTVSRLPAISRIQTSGGNRAFQAPATVEASISQMRGSGQPLPAEEQNFFEERMGYDFSHVRIHTDSNAVQASRDIQAQAFTVGNNIAFSEGAYQPGTNAGRRLLAHELTHVLQQREKVVSDIQRNLVGCQNLIQRPPIASLISGSAVHTAIAQHFLATVTGATTVAIPGASAGPLRSSGICGADITRVVPQIIGGRAGLGFPDLAQKTPSGILLVAEIKPAVIPCLIDGEEQLLRYINQGNARDPQQVTWRQSQGITTVSPMLPSTYNPPPLNVTVPGAGSVTIIAEWCNAGLLAYTVEAQVHPVRVGDRVTTEDRVRVRDQYRREININDVLVPVAVGGAVVAGRALWRHFWAVVARRFAARGAVAVLLSAADGPLPVGELISAGLAIVTVIEIMSIWDELWREADRIAAQGA